MELPVPPCGLGHRASDGGGQHCSNQARRGYCSLYPYFAKLAEQAGVPPGVVNVVTGFGHTAGQLSLTMPYGGCNLSGCGGGVLGPETLSDYLRNQTVARLLS